MKSVLISIQPKWCELIASCKKIVEVRKTRPKIETPFKVYIYCTKSRKPYESFAVSGKPYECGGKVIGEFVCDAIIADKTFGHDVLFKASACMSDADISAYCLNKEMYGWHISNLVIYEQPKELNEFWHKGGMFNSKYDNIDDLKVIGTEVYKPLKRPPQSWCYVEGKEDEGK